MSDTTTKQVAFRLPTDLLDRVQDYAARRTDAEPGLELSLTGAVRILLEAGLRAEEVGTRAPRAARPRER